jgi:hypothetical protein
MDPAASQETIAERTCGDCSLCCTVLRVDALRKLGGVACVHQDVAGPGCAIHPERPGICRAYRCLWLAGGLEAGDRPDRLGAVVDLVSDGPTVRLEIREARPGAFEGSARLQAIAARYRRSMPVRISDVGDVLDADRPFRLLMPDGEEHRVAGEWREVVRASGETERLRLPWAERWARRALLALRRRWVRGYRGSDGLGAVRRPD